MTRKYYVCFMTSFPNDAEPKKHNNICLFFSILKNQRL